jgi:hypothetical protein
MSGIVMATTVIHISIGINRGLSILLFKVKSVFIYICGKDTKYYRMQRYKKSGEPQKENKFIFIPAYSQGL